MEDAARGIEPTLALQLLLLSSKVHNHRVPHLSDSFIVAKVGMDTLHRSQTQGCPIHRAFAMGGNVYTLPQPAVAVA
jgi:hypothetical protein